MIFTWKHKQKEALSMMTVNNTKFNDCPMMLYDTSITENMHKKSRARHFLSLNIAKRTLIIVSEFITSEE